MKRLDLALKVGKDTVRFEVERVTIEPFDSSSRRATTWSSTGSHLVRDEPRVDQEDRRHGRPSRVQQPVVDQSMEKHTTYCAMMRLGRRARHVAGAAQGIRAQAGPQAHARALRAALRPRPRRADARLPDVHEALRWRRLGGRVADRRRDRAARRVRESGKHVMHLRRRSSRTTCSFAASASGRRRGSSATIRPRRCTIATPWIATCCPPRSSR